MYAPNPADNHWEVRLYTVWNYILAHQKLGTPVGCCLSTEAYAHLWLCMTPYSVACWSMKAGRHGTFMECCFFFFFFWYNRYMEVICKFPLETWLRAFQAYLRGYPFRATFLYSTLSWFHMALSFPSPCYHLNPNFMCLFIRSFIPPTWFPCLW